MIALVIIGILVSFAVPSYNSYIVRTKVTEVSNIANFIGNKILECTLFNGGDYQECNSLQKIGISSDNIDIATIENVLVDADTPAFIVALQNTGDNALDQLSLQFSINSLSSAIIKWHCQISSNSGNNFVPKRCKAP